MPSPERVALRAVNSTDQRFKLIRQTVIFGHEGRWVFGWRIALLNPGIAQGARPDLLQALCKITAQHKRFCKFHDSRPYLLIHYSENPKKRKNILSSFHQMMLDR